MKPLRRILVVIRDNITTTLRYGWLPPLRCYTPSNTLRHYYGDGLLIAIDCQRYIAAPLAPHVVSEYWLAATTLVCH